MKKIEPEQDRVVSGPFTLKGGTLTFRTESGLLGYDARKAMAAGQDLTVSISRPEATRELTGKVVNVELLEQMKPLQWEIVIRVSA